MPLSLARYSAYCILLIFLACGCKKADVSPGTDVPPVGNASPILDMEIKSVRPGPDDVLCEVVLTNKTDKPIGVGGFSLVGAVAGLKLQDGSGRVWLMTASKISATPDLSNEILAPHIPKLIMVQTFYGMVLARDYEQEASITNSPPPNGTYHYSLRRDRTLWVYDGDMRQHSEIPVTAEGDTSVTAR